MFRVARQKMGAFACNRRVENRAVLFGKLLGRQLMSGIFNKDRPRSPFVQTGEQIRRKSSQVSPRLLKGEFGSHQ